MAVLLLAICVSPFASSDDMPKKTAEDVTSYGEDFDHEIETEIERNPDPMTLVYPCSDLSEEKVKASCNSAMERYYEYYNFGATHRENIFKWQHFSSKVIFFSALILVYAGLYFAWIQFRLDQSVSKRKTGVRLKGDATQEGSEGKVREDAELKPRSTFSKLKVGLDGLEVSSPVLGVVILVISLAFFYLYLIYVYPMNETF